MGIKGLFYRTIRIMENGIKPVYVFDGKPPSMKAGELLKRTERREEAQKELTKAEEAGDAEAIDKFSRRLVKVTPQHNDECKRLLRLMGVPYIEAPCEAEAQFAALSKAGKVFAAGTEDMDALTFGTGVLLRHLTFSEMKKAPIQEFHLSRVLAELDFTMEQFVDLCIMLGCDYCDTIRGIGPKKSIELIRQHKSIEKVLDNLDQTKYPPPDDWLYQEARRLFREAEVDADVPELKWCDPDEEQLVAYLCGEKGFSEDRVRSGAKKIVKAKGSAVQSRLDSFFTLSSPKPLAQKNAPSSAGNPAKRMKTEKDEKNKKGSSTPAAKAKAKAGGRK